MILRLSTLKTCRVGKYSSSRCALRPFPLRLSVFYRKFLLKLLSSNSPLTQAPTSRLRCACHPQNYTINPKVFDQSVQNPLNQTAALWWGWLGRVCNCLLRPRLVERVEIQNFQCKKEKHKALTMSLTFWECYFELKVKVYWNLL